MGLLNMLKRKAAAGKGSSLPVELAEAIRQRLPQVISWLTGRPIWTDWSTENAITNGLKASTWVYACNRKLASSISSVPWIVETLQGTEWVHTPDHPLETLLSKPNRFMSGQDLIERLSHHLHLGGNGLWHIIAVAGTPIELWPLQPDRIKPVVDPQKWITKYKYRVGTEEKDVDAGQVIHFMFCDPGNPYWGLSPLKAAAMTVDSDIEAMKWNKVSLQNRSVPDGVFSFKQPLTIEQWEEARQMIAEQAQGIDNSHAPWVVGSDADYKKMAHTPIEMDFLNTRKFNREEICAVYGVPTLLVGAQDRPSYNNLTTAKRMFWEDTVIPILDDIESALNLSLVRYWDPSVVGYNKQASLRVRYDVSQVAALQESYTEKVKAAQLLFLMGVPFNTINERLELGFEPIPGGDEPGNAPKAFTDSMGEEEGVGKGLIPFPLRGLPSDSETRPSKKRSAFGPRGNHGLPMRL